MNTQDLVSQWNKYINDNDYLVIYTHDDKRTVISQPLVINNDVICSEDLAMIFFDSDDYPYCIGDLFYRLSAIKKIDENEYNFLRWFFGVIGKVLMRNMPVLINFDGLEKQYGKPIPESLKTLLND